MRLDAAHRLAVMSQAIADLQVTRKSSRWPTLVLALLAASAFGPYVAGGIRTDQVATYVIGGTMALFTLWWVRANRAVGWVAVLWAIIPLFGAISWLTVPRYRGGGTVGNLDALLLPLFVITVTVVCAHYGDREQLLRVAAAVVVAGMSVNSMLIFAQLFGSDLGFIRPWLPRGEDYVATRADTLGRFTGFLNQPALAGTMYGLALLLAIYLFRRRGLTLTLTLVLLSTAGLVTQSKAFLYVGLPVAALCLIAAIGSRSVAALAAAIVGAGLFWWQRETVFHALVNRVPGWGGADRLERLLFGGLDVETVTGNRFGDAGSVGPVIAGVLSQSPLAGYGLSGIPTAVDSAWLAVVTISGLVGVLALGAVLVTLWGAVLARRSAVRATERILGTGTLVILTATSLAFPVFTGNRLSIVVWIVITLLLLAPKTRTEPHEALDEDVSSRLPTGRSAAGVR